MGLRPGKTKGPWVGTTGGGGGGGGLTVWQDHIRAIEDEMYILANGSYGRSSTSGSPSSDDNWWTRIDTITAQGNCKLHFHKALHPWYNGGAITARLHFLMSTSPSTGNATFELYAQGLVDGNSAAFNPASVGNVTKNFAATPRYYYADIGPFTPAGAAAGCFLFCRLHRTDVNSDIYPRLMEVTFTYTVTNPG